MTVGNHESDFGREGMKTLVAQARFPVVAANVVFRSGDRLSTKAYVMRAIGGVRVGILGLAYSQVWRMMVVARRMQSWDNESQRTGSDGTFGATRIGGCVDRFTIVALIGAAA